MIAKAFLSFALWSLMIQVFYVFAPEIRAAGLAQVFSLWVILTAMLMVVIMVVILVKLSEGEKWKGKLRE